MVSSIQKNGAAVRYERKFTAPGLHLSEIEYAIRFHPSLFREEYPKRVVNSLYLDSPNLKDYHDHLNGVAERSKTRIRWYGESPSVASVPKLERKMKRGLVGEKRVHSLGTLTIGRGDADGWRETLAGTALPEPFCWAVLLRTPTVYNRYLRRYFVSADRKYRLTIDTDLEVCGAAEGFGKARWRKVELPGAIIELKYGLGEADEVGRVTACFPFPLTRYSKYLVAVERTLSA